MESIQKIEEFRASWSHDIDIAELSSKGFMKYSGSSKDGFKTLFVNWDDWSEDLSNPDVMQELQMKTMFSINDISTARDGIKIVHDLREWRYAKMHLNVVRKLAKTISYLPFRVKGVYFVKGPW